ncbi:hypothetical protein [Candidatus Amarolinea dominans]|uniref:hypothetical protein n=1 Tax=Candidatus Amarolinea dominans TaxID=3140696 RepID=UPI003135825F|nr:hypothetical protein [Anaerolineae bacterium]
MGFVTFIVTLVIQAFHASEHILQMLQKYVWHLTRFPGLLGVWFDFEWIHLLMNLAILLSLLATWILYTKNPGMWRDSALADAMLAFLLYFQGYHVLDTHPRPGIPAGGALPTPGILGRIFPVLEFHFFLNAVLTTAMIVAFVGFQPWRVVASRRGQPLQPRRAH